MYGAVDVGGTKTLIAVFSADGKLVEKQKFPTPTSYQQFLTELAANVDKLSTRDFRAVGVAIPAKVDRTHGSGSAFGNLSWGTVNIKSDAEKILQAPVVVENDANLAGLSEAAALASQYARALYLTISTGIGTGFVMDGALAPSLLDGEGGWMVLEHEGEMRVWETFASGKAIVAKYGKRASEIDDPETWAVIARNIAKGLINLLAIFQPDVVILGGGVGTHYSKYALFLDEELHKYETHVVPVPPIIQARRPEEAVIYGCYELARQTHG